MKSTSRPSISSAGPSPPSSRSRWSISRCCVSSTIRCREIGPFFFGQTRTGAFATEATNTFRYAPPTTAVASALVEERERLVAQVRRRRRPQRRRRGPRREASRCRAAECAGAAPAGMLAAGRKQAAGFGASRMRRRKACAGLRQAGRAGGACGSGQGRSPTRTPRCGLSKKTQRAKARQSVGERHRRVFYKLSTPGLAEGLSARMTLATSISTRRASKPASGSSRRPTGTRVVVTGKDGKAPRQRSRRRRPFRNTASRPAASPAPTLWPAKPRRR